MGIEGHHDPHKCAANMLSIIRFWLDHTVFAHPSKAMQSLNDSMSRSRSRLVGQSFAYKEEGSGMVRTYKLCKTNKTAPRRRIQ